MSQSSQVRAFYKALRYAREGSTTYYSFPDACRARVIFDSEFSPAGTVSLELIELAESRCHGRGHASEMLARIVSAADIHGITLDLLVYPPEDNPTLSVSQLMRWYKKFGFVPGVIEENSVDMQRVPRRKARKNPVRKNATEPDTPLGHEQKIERWARRYFDDAAVYPWAWGELEHVANGGVSHNPDLDLSAKDAADVLKHWRWLKESCLRQTSREARLARLRWLRVEDADLLESSPQEWRRKHDCKGWRGRLKEKGEVAILSWHDEDCQLLPLSQRPPRRSRRRSCKNPKGGSEVYDPREEQLRAQRQAIYETSLSRKFERPFRDARGKRLDAKIINEKGLDWLRPYMQRRMFAMGTGVQQRHGRLKPGSQTPTRKAITESKKRYSDVDKLLRNRQDYEESLGIARKGGFYRITQEPTDMGLMYSVWPLPPRQRLPKIFVGEREAIAEVRRLNATKDPLRTDKWWVPPKKKYTKRGLAYWLPPTDFWRR